MATSKKLALVGLTLPDPKIPNYKNTSYDTAGPLPKVEVPGYRPTYKDTHVYPDYSVPEDVENRRSAPTSSSKSSSLPISKWSLETSAQVLAKKVYPKGLQPRGAPAISKADIAKKMN